MKLSVCMIVKDEEAVLARCLESVKEAADEIVIADTGSTDGTRAIAERYTDAVYDFPWADDFAAARNFSFGKATGDYLMWLDADDVIEPAMLPRLIALKEKTARENADMVLCKYRSGRYEYFRERILKRGKGFRWTGRVHECIPPCGKVFYDGFTVTHCQSPKPHGTRNLHIYQKWRAEETLGGRDLFYYGRELFYNKLYTEAEAVLKEMLSGDGWYVNKIEACKVLAACRAATGRKEEALSALLQSFSYGMPRGGVCCEIGRIFRAAGRHREAVCWYEAALACPSYAAEGDFDDADARTLFPLIGLTCSRWALGEREKSLACHRRAAVLSPSHPAVVHNEAFFRKTGMLPPNAPDPPNAPNPPATRGPV